jgi:hypothetical protein
MSGDALRVTTAHLADLATRQASAAADTRSATCSVEGVDVAVRRTHGSIASATAGAVETVIATRRDAGARIATISDDLCHELADAARRYDQVDDAQSGLLDGQMR